MMMDTPPAIHHTVEGRADGQVVVLLNGGMMSGFAWEPIAKELTPTFRVVRLDFRGQLMSPRRDGEPELPADLEGHARDVVSVLDRLEIETAHIVGTSFGALVGLALAAEHPDRVRSLIALTATARLSPEMLAGTRALRALAQEALAGGDGGKVLDAIVPGTYSPEWIAANAQMLALRRVQVAALPKTWYAGLDALLGVIERAEPRRYLARILCPVGIVAAEKDLTFPLPNSEELARDIPGAVLRVIPGAPHGVALERPAESLAVVQELLADFAARSPAAAREAPP